MEIPIVGVKGCHYKISFRHECHEIALHFQGTKENNAIYLAYFQPHIDQLSAELGFPLKSDNHEADRKRLWIKLPLSPLTLDLLEKYSDMTARLIILTLPILKSILDEENRSSWV
jgi:hypothetical protein